jgi:hypothetical protein
MLKESKFNWIEALSWVNSQGDFGIQKSINGMCSELIRLTREDEERELKKFMAETGLQPKDIVMKAVTPYYRFINGHVYRNAYWFEKAPDHVPDYII